MNQNHATPPFLLVECGPLFDLEARVGLIRKDMHQTERRALLAALFAWLPLLVLSGLQGMAFGHRIQLPFLRDFSAWSRFLFAIPLLVLAERSLGPRIVGAVEHFLASGVVGPKDYQQFDRIVEQGLRLRDSKVAEIVAAILAYLFAITGFRLTAATGISTWYATQVNGRESLTWAGWWLICFSAPLLHFLMLRWLWRLFLWFQFLGRVCHLNLRLFPTHPDKAAGLGFVGSAQLYFRILLFACSIGVAGVLANEIVYDGISLRHFGPGIAVYALLAVAVVVAPLAVFTRTLLRTKRRGLYEYGTLATSYTGSFHRKWIIGNPGDQSLLGTADIQSLADLGNSYTFVERMYAVPIDPSIVVHLLIATVLPLAPLLLTLMPLREIVKLLFKFLA